MVTIFYCSIKVTEQNKECIFFFFSVSVSIATYDPFELLLYARKKNFFLYANQIKEFNYCSKNILAKRAKKKNLLNIFYITNNL